MVECVNNPNENTIKNIFENIKCINTVTVWFIILLMSACISSLIGVLWYRNNYNNSLKVTFFYFISLFGISIIMLGVSQATRGSGNSSIITITLLIITLMVLSFVGQYAFLKKGTCKPEDKNVPKI